MSEHLKSPASTSESEQTKQQAKMNAIRSSLQKLEEEEEEEGSGDDRGGAQRPAGEEGARQVQRGRHHRRPEEAGGGADGDARREDPHPEVVQHLQGPHHPQGLRDPRRDGPRALLQLDAAPLAGMNLVMDGEQIIPI